MPFDPAYLLLFFIVLQINLIPAFMPPTWIILSYFLLTFQLAFFPVIVLGAIAATAGRVGLAYLGRHFFFRFFSHKSQQNFIYLGNFLKDKNKLTIPIVISYAFLPIPSNQMFLAAGMANLNIKLVAFSFLMGRLISYTVWISATHYAISRLDTVFSKQITHTQTIMLELASFLILFAIAKIPWKAILEKRT